jgi:elongation factor P
MNTETYDQIALNTEQLGDALQYLSENATCQILTHDDQAIGVELSAAVELKVAQTDSWVRGDTAQGGTKPARLETGLIVQVPLFINTDDVIKVDTRTGAYLERAGGR